MSRIIVKGLPKNITEPRLRKVFEDYGTITDLSLKYTQDGVFRRFAFVGFESEDSGKVAVKKLNNTFVQTSKVEECMPFSSENKPRPWSKYAKGSSAYKRLHGNDGDEEAVDEKAPTGKKVKAEVQVREEKAKPKKESVGGDEMFKKFLAKQGIPMDEEEDIAKKENTEDDEKIALFQEKFDGLPPAVKQKNFREFISPIKPHLIQFCRLAEEAVAIVTFNRAADLKRALERHDHFLGGHKVKISRMQEDKSRDDPEKKPDATVDAELEKARIREEILDTGRLFLRNLPYICTDEHLMEAFRKFGEIAEVQCIIDKRSGACKGFAIVTFIFPEHALKAYEEMDGTIFKGRMLHIIPGESKKEVSVPSTSNDFEGLTKFQADRAKQVKECAGKDHNWNPLFIGANATADTLADRLGVDKHALLTESGDQSAAVRLAMAETQLVMETKEFLSRNNVAAENSESGKRSQTTIVVKNLPAGERLAKELRASFERYGELKRIDFAPGGGLSAVVEMGNKVDAKRAFNLIAYSRLPGSDQPLYLEWAAAAPPTEGTSAEEKPIDAKWKKKIARVETANDDEETFGEEDDEDVAVKENGNEAGAAAEREKKPKRTKLIVRNVPFQASLEEVAELFSAFGEIRDLRMPRKAGSFKQSSQHRGFCFVDFVSHSDAKRAMNALKLSTHLYGRRLVLEWAKAGESVDEMREKSSRKLSSRHTKASTKKQLREAMENRPDDDDVME